MNKPISPMLHGIIDYALGVAQMALPAVLGVPKRTTRFYQAMSVPFTAVNMATDTPVGLAPYLSVRDHQKADVGFLGGLALYSFSKQVRRNKAAAIFHFTFLGVAALHYLLTDYNDVSHEGM